MSEQQGRGRTEGDAQRIGAEALGEPGQRRFRLLAIVEGITRVVWMEKEQLRRLGQAIEELLLSVPKQEPGTGATDTVSAFDPESSYQIRAGRMELNFDEERGRLIIVAHDLEAGDDAPPSFVCRLTLAQSRELAEEAAEVVSAGRPICPLCERPMGPGVHVCEQQNGHFPHRIEEVREDPEEES